MTPKMKLETTKNLLQELLNSKQKIVVFCHHQHVIEEIVKFCKEQKIVNILYFVYESNFIFCFISKFDH